MEFPVTNLYELDSRVFQVLSHLNKRPVWMMNTRFAGQLEHPVQAGGEPWQVLGCRHQARCRRPPRAGRALQEVHRAGELISSSTGFEVTFVFQVMPEAFRKLLTSHATHRWQTEIQEGILLMCELFIELLTTRMQYDPVPCHMLNTLALIFDTKNDWNHKNKDQAARGRWHTATGTTARYMGLHRTSSCSQ